jgi:hypothetical protein
MAQKQAQKVVNKFVKGLITEAGELTFPEDASVDELNCDLRRDGSRRRRRGVATETNAVLSTFTIGDNDIVSTGTWENVGGSSQLEYLVVQVGATLYFYNKATTPTSGNYVTEGTIDLTSHEITGGVGAANVACQFTSISGQLVVASPAIDTIRVYRDYDILTQVYSNVAEEIDFKVRDFKWFTDKEELTTESSSSTITNGRRYDTYNAGWFEGTDPGYRDGDAALSKYRNNENNRYPPLTHPWFSGKNASNEYDHNEFREVWAGRSLTANGLFILDFFNKDRGTAAGMSSSLNETENSRFATVAAFGGRVFYAGLDSQTNSGTVLYSPLIKDNNDLGDCYQVNDPTSELISDLLDTDGGELKITGAYGIRKLYAIGQSLMVFADNGTWTISGVDGVFKATEFSINKVSDVGILNSSTFVEAAGTPFWWSREGIHTVQFDKVNGSPSEANISLPTIQTYYDALTNAQKATIKSGFDRVNRRIYWGYADSGEAIGNKINNILILDLELRAFIPWRIEDQESNTDHVLGFVYLSGFGSALSTLDVVDQLGNDVVTSAGDDVVSQQLATVDAGSPSIALLIRDGATNKFTIGGFSDTGFLDWGEANYSSYAVAGYDFMGDLQLKKSAPYITSYLRRTETGWESDGLAGYNPIGASSCKITAYWDFRTAGSSVSQQVYRLKPNPVVDAGDLTDFDYPENVVTSRVKVRGRGRSIRLKYESEQGKDFILLGWSMIGGINARY